MSDTPHDHAQLAYAAGQLTLLQSDEEIAEKLADKFGCSHDAALSVLAAAEARSLFGERDKRKFQDRVAQAQLGLFRAALARKGKVRGEGLCPECNAEVEVFVEVPKPALSVAAGQLRAITDLWNLQAVPEDLLGSDELRIATVKAMISESERFTDDELADMVSEFQEVIQQRMPAQTALPFDEP